MHKLNLWLIRHGESMANAGVWSANPAESPLSARGQQQAADTAAKIITEPNLIVCSPFLRARQSAEYITNIWPETAIEIWPIQEFIYLSPSSLIDLTSLERKAKIEHYWHQADPYRCDGVGAESFAAFLKRVELFYQEIKTKNGLVIAVGHGLFFKAFQQGLSHGFVVSPAWMNHFREQELALPIKNSEICSMLL